MSSSCRWLMSPISRARLQSGSTRLRLTAAAGGVVRRMGFASHPPSLSKQGGPVRRSSMSEGGPVRHSSMSEGGSDTHHAAKYAWNWVSQKLYLSYALVESLRNNDPYWRYAKPVAWVELLAKPIA